MKLLDFGIAKLLAATAKSGAASTMTQLGQRAFTPEYAAPEQFREQRVGTATDVYALGGVLFELLTGRRPFDLEGRSFAEVERTVCEADPPRPSLSLRSGHWQSLGERSASRARERIAGNLDAIVLMALRKEPERRYPSVEQLRRDLLDHAAGRAISARPEGVTHRLRRWVLRHRLEVGVAALALVLLLGGAATAALAAVSLLGGVLATGWQARRAQAEARLAEQAARDAEIERAKAERVRDFIARMLGATESRWIGPVRGGRPDISVAEVLDRAAAEADEQLQDEPELQAEIRYTLGKSYGAIGRFDRAVDQLEAALALERMLHPGPHVDVARCLLHLGGTYLQAGEPKRARELLRESPAQFEAAEATADPFYALAWADLASAAGYLGEHAEARELFLRVRELLSDHWSEVSPVGAITYGNLAVCAANAGELAEAERLHRRAAEIYDLLAPQEFREAAGNLNNLGLVTMIRGNFEQAERLLERALEMEERLAPDAYHSVWVRGNLTTVRYYLGDYGEAERRLEAAMAVTRRFFSEDSTQMARARYIQGWILNATGHPAEAESVLWAALEVYDRIGQDWRNAFVRAGIGRSLSLQGRFDEAEPMLRQGYADFRRAYPEEDVRTRELAAWLAELTEERATRSCSTAAQ